MKGRLSINSSLLGRKKQYDHCWLLLPGERSTVEFLKWNENFAKVVLFIVSFALFFRFEYSHFDVVSIFQRRIRFCVFLRVFRLFVVIPFSNVTSKNKIWFSHFSFSWLCYCLRWVVFLPSITWTFDVNVALLSLWSANSPSIFHVREKYCKPFTIPIHMSDAFFSPFKYPETKNMPSKLSIQQNVWPFQSRSIEQNSFPFNSLKLLFASTAQIEMMKVFLLKLPVELSLLSRFLFLHHIN